MNFVIADRFTDSLARLGGDEQKAAPEPRLAVAAKPMRFAEVADAAGLEAVCNTGRHLRSVACAHTRDRLSASGVMPASEFLDDLRA